MISLAHELFMSEYYTLTLSVQDIARYKMTLRSNLVMVSFTQRRHPDKFNFPWFYFVPGFNMH